MRVSAVIAIDSILISISGIAGDGFTLKSDSNDGIVTVPPDDESTERPVETTKDVLVEPPKERAAALAPLTTVRM